MPTRNPAFQRFSRLLASLGRAAIHEMYPDEFEYYGMMLELRDSRNRIENLLVFPVLPDNIQINRTHVTNIQKTASGVTTLTNNTFIPFNISISGSFGRKFRILIGTEIADGAAFSINLGYSDRAGIEFDAKIKTGYGVTKIIERLCEAAVQVDSQGQPKRLFLYNLAFNHVYLVEVRNYNFMQDLSSNMIWRYDLLFTAIAPAGTIYDLDESTSIETLLYIDNIQKGLDTLTTTVREEVKKGIINAAGEVPPTNELLDKITSSSNISRKRPSISD